MSDYRHCYCDLPKGYSLLYFCVGHGEEFVVTNDIDHAVHNDFPCLFVENDVLISNPAATQCHKAE